MVWNEQERQKIVQCIQYINTRGGLESIANPRERLENSENKRIVQEIEKKTEAGCKNIGDSGGKMSKKY